MSTSEDFESITELTGPATTDAPEPEPTSTPGPLEQQASSEFQGWSIGPSESSAMTCDPGVNFQTSGRYGSCCGEEPCAMATICSDNTVTYDNQQTFDCGTDFSCVTMTIYQTPAPFDVGDATSAIICGANWQAHTVYRNLPPEPTTTDEPESTTQLSSRGSSATSSTDSAGPTESGDSGDNSDSGSSTPIGAIAGGVVGGIALVGILVFAIWWLRRRSAKRDAATSVQSTGNYGGGYAGYGGYGAPGGGGGDYPSETTAAMSQSDRHTWTQSPYQGSEPNPSPGYPMPHGHQPVPQQPPVSELGATQGWHAGQAMELDASYASESGRQRPVSELPVDDHYGPGGSGHGR